MAIYQPGDYIKVEFREDTTGESEWMWVKVEHAYDDAQVVFGPLGNEPIVNRGLRRGMELGISACENPHCCVAAKFSGELGLAFPGTVTVPVESWCRLASPLASSASQVVQVEDAAASVDRGGERQSLPVGSMII